MYSVSFDVSKFEQYVLPSTSNPFSMPSDTTVVSVDKDGNPVSYFGNDVWDFNTFFNLTNEPKSLYQINFHPKEHNPKLLIELKQRIYFLIWGAQGSLLHMDGDTFRKFSQCHNIARRSNCALRVFKGTSIESFSLLSNELVFSQLLHEGKQHSEQTVAHRLKALSVLAQLNPHFPEQRHFSLGLPEGKTIEKIAKQYSSAGEGHFPTVIPVIYEQLMGCIFRSNPDTDSGITRTVIPR